MFFSGDNLNDLQQLVNNELDLFYNWFTANKLSLNIDKTNYVVFSNSEPFFDFDIHLNGKPLVRTNKVKFLGVIIDSKLSWHDHIDCISSKVSRGVGILSKLKHILPSHVLRCIYLSLVLPHYSYCSIIWSACSKSYMNKLIILQKRAIRHVRCSKNYDHTSPLFSSLNLLKLPDLINTNIATFAFRCIHGNLSNYFKAFFMENNQIHSYNTRQRDNIHSFPCRNNTALSSLRNRAVNLWNSLPLKIKSLNTVSQFRKHLKAFFILAY